MSDVLSFGDKLKIEGINFKGFGIIPKFVMIDRDLSIEAKGIYAYFASFAGNGTTTFPGRTKILSDLNISKTCYYNHFNLLKEQGYIKVDREKSQNNHFSRNVFTLVENPKKFKETPEDPSQIQAYSRIRYDGIKSVGYGMIPKSVMIDSRLPLKSKAIYAYFCSYSGTGNTAFPKKSQILYHLGITENTYYKFYNLLASLNYIYAVQRHTGGRLQVNDYYLCTNPDDAKVPSKAVRIASEQYLNIKDTEEKQDLKKQDMEKQDLKKRDLKKQDLKKHDSVIYDTNITSLFLNKNKLEYNQSINHQAPDPITTKVITPSHREIDGTSELSEEEFNEKFFETTDEILNSKKIPYSVCGDEKMVTALVHWMTEWDVFYPHGYNDELQQRVYNLFNHALIEMLITDRTMTLNRSVTTYAKVLDRVNELTEFNDSYVNVSEFMDPAMDHYIKGSLNTEIRNPVRYMMACIWEVLQTGNIQLYEQLNRDGFGS